MAIFERVCVDALPDLAIRYLDKAIKRTPASTSRLDVTLQLARKFGDLYLVKDGEDLIGAVYLLVYNTEHGKVLSPVLVGGRNLSRWKKDLFDFLMAELKRVEGVACRFIARKGWMRAYPMCKNIGTIYEFTP